MTSLMTVAEIKAILDSNIYSDEFIGQLKSDQRVTVAKLYHKWMNEQKRKQQEFDRLKLMYQYEQKWINRGYPLVAGVDEAGRGPLAGPVVIATVILPLDCFIPGLNDSKKLTEAKREELYPIICEKAIAVSSTVISREMIDSLNIYQATVEGMYKVLSQVLPQPNAVLIDAVKLHKLSIPYEAIIHGDALSASIAAASVVAKVTRDRLMYELDKKYPVYGFAKHKGYGTEHHVEAIRKYGPCPEHRISFEPIKSLLGARNCDNT